jgi:diaminopimelate epimerase
MMDFAKYEALGNDYLIIDPQLNSLEVTGDVARLLCDRHHGIGADGVLYGPFFSAGELRVRIFNSDGSECEKSGNGLRIFARYLYERRYVDGTRFTINTLAGPAAAEIVEPQRGVITVSMGTYTHASDRIPITGPPREAIGERIHVDDEVVEATCVNVGNPHCVVPRNQVSRADAVRIGPRLSCHPVFPHRTNVQLMAVADRSTISIEIWDRGSGYTLASGSSSCAAATCAHTLGMVDPSVDVQMPGGVIHVDITEDNVILMTGIAQPIAMGELDPSFQRRLQERAQASREGAGWNSVA